MINPLSHGVGDDVRRHYLPHTYAADNYVYPLYQRMGHGSTQNYRQYYKYTFYDSQTCFPIKHKIDANK